MPANMNLNSYESDSSESEFSSSSFTGSSFFFSSSFFLGPAPLSSSSSSFSSKLGSHATAIDFSESIPSPAKSAVSRSYSSTLSFNLPNSPNLSISFFFFSLASAFTSLYAFDAFSIAAESLLSWASSNLFLAVLMRC